MVKIFFIIRSKMHKKIAQNAIKFKNFRLQRYEAFLST